MANPIIPKYNANPLNTNAPAAANLTTGELASNLTSGKLYLKLYDGSVKEISGQVSSVNSSIGDIVITPQNIGAIATSELGATVATLDGGGKLPYAQLPSIGTSEISALTTSAIAGLIPQLDAGGKISLDQIPSSVIGGLTYQGAWDASTNTPQLDSGVGTKGHYYVVSVPGNTMLDGHNDWLSGDLVIFDGTAWDKVSGNDSEVVSVNNVTPVNGNITLSPSNVGAVSTADLTTLTLANKVPQLTSAGLLSTNQIGATTTSQIGGLIVGDNLTVDANGRVSAVQGTYTLPAATTSTLGGIKAGSGLSVTLDGTLSADIATSSDAGRVKPGTGLLVDGSGTLTPDNTYVICTDTDPQYFNGGTY
jgi:hypothetical protein